MLKNYLILAWRNIRRKKAISAINIAGLSLAFAFILLIGGYIWQELNVNHSLKHISQQYILQSSWKEVNTGPEITTLAPLAQQLKQNYPHLVANYYRWDGITSVVSNGTKSFREEIQLGDSTLLSMFGFELLQGDARTALDNSSSVVITSQTAIKYFGSLNVIGKVLRVENFSGQKKDYAISGVLKNQETNSVTSLSNSGSTQLFLPNDAIRFFERSSLNDWNNSSVIGYIELQEGVSAETVEKAAKELIAKNGDDFYKSNLTVHVKPLSSYHLETDKGLIKKMLYTLSFICLFILLMSLVNFTTISMQVSGGRMREIGVRKVLGAVKSQLIFQFLSESMLLVIVAMIFSLFLYQLFLPVFSDILGKPLNNLYDFPAASLPVFLATGGFIGLLSGAFPALVLSSLKTIDALKGTLKGVHENIFVRKLLVGLQFSLAIFILSGAVIISMQVSLFFSDQLGYDKEHLITIKTPRNWNTEGVNHMKAMRDELIHLPEVSDASLSYAIPNGNAGGSMSLVQQGETAVPVSVTVIEADENYARTYNIPVVSGKFLENDLHPNDVVINEAALKAFGWQHAEEALGKQVAIPGTSEFFTIKGIIRNFHFESMKEHIKPLCFLNVNVNPRYRYLSLKLKNKDLSKTIEHIHQKWKSLFPGAPFEYSFMNDTLASVYKTEIQLKKAAFIATLLSVVIVLLGIIGLVSVSIQKRIKEIGIRKVLGASVPGIIKLFLTEFIALTFIAGLFACPLAYLTLANWLNNYSYKIEPGVLPFLFSIFSLVILTIMVVSIQTLKTSLTNPVKNLRTE